MLLQGVITQKSAGGTLSFSFSFSVFFASPVGLEPTTCGIEARCSIQLSYEEDSPANIKHLLPACRQAGDPLRLQSVFLVRRRATEHASYYTLYR